MHLLLLEFLLGPSCPLTSFFYAADMLNTHEELRSRPTTWMVRGFWPHTAPIIAKYIKIGGNSANILNVELMAQCSDVCSKAGTRPMPIRWQ